MSRIDELFAKYFRRLVGLLARETDAEDIAQETIIATWKRLDRVSPEKEWPYLAKSARNRLSRQRTRANVPRHGGGQLRQLEDEHDAHDERPSAEDELLEREESAEVLAAFQEVMAQLSPETQQALVLRSRDLGSKEIARLLGMTDQAVRTRLSRAFALFRRHDDDHEK